MNPTFLVRNWPRVALQNINRTGFKVLNGVLTLFLAFAGIGVTALEPARASGPTVINTSTPIPSHLPAGQEIVPIQFTSDIDDQTDSWSVSSGTIPNGLSLNALTGILSGTPVSDSANPYATYSYTIRVSDGSNTFTSSTFTTRIVTGLSINNYLMKFGNGTENSLNNKGFVQQPFYGTGNGSTFYQLTHSGYPLDMAVGHGTGSGHWSGSTVTDLLSGSPTVNYTRFDYSRFVWVQNVNTTAVRGYGQFITKTGYTVGGKTIEIEQIINLGQNDSFVKVESSIKNLNGTSLDNVYFWVGTRDENLAGSDQQVLKQKGNLNSSNQFVQIASASTPAKMLKLSYNGSQVLFFTTKDGANMALNNCCSFASAYNQNPTTSAITHSSDGSYSAVFPFGNIASQASSKVTWFYLAGSDANIPSILESVAAAANPPPAPNIAR